jgi:pentatricopeptide repeat protein
LFKALAVHPDYLLRQEILRTLRDRWLPLSPDGWHSVVAGLIREEQFELALDHLDHMVTMGIPVQSWLHGLLVYNLCDLGDFDQVFNVMKERTSQQQNISMDLWMYVLDVASKASHHETTSYVWKQVVEMGYLNPSYGVCSNILTLASHTGDVQLATSVIRFLVKAEAPLSLEDYKKLAETYTMAGDLDGALDTLCSMQDAGIQVEESSTRPVFTYMVQRKMEPQNIWKGLKRLKAQGRNVPVGCANVVIEYCEHHLTHSPSALTMAIKFYKELYELCPGGADVATYNCLISLCRRAKRPDACMFVVKEMAALGVAPNAITFERIILMCLELGNFRSGYMYFQDLLERGWTLDEGTCGEIRELCQGSEDEFAVRLIDHPMISGLG